MGNIDINILKQQRKLVEERWKRVANFKLTADDIKSSNKINMEKYKRNSASISEEELKKIDYFAKKSDFIEISYWHNGEGFDVEIGYSLPQKFQLTWGQFEAMKKLIKFLDKE